MDVITPELNQLIQRAIRDCGLQIAPLAAQSFEVTEKGPEDYVTTIDALLDKQLSACFRTLFPGDGVITEEDTKSRQFFHADHDRLWFIDPLDGTEDLIHGRQNYAVMVGLLDRYEPLAGWVYSPVQDRMYFGGKDWGLFQATATEAAIALPVVEPKPPTAGFCPILIGHRDQKRYGPAIAEYIPEAQFYSIGSFGLKVLEVIMGHAGLYLYLNQRVKLWDTTGPLAMARMAGLTCCSLEGEPLRFSPDAIDPQTLAHHQSIVIGWPHYVEELRPKLESAVKFALQN